MISSFYESPSSSSDTSDDDVVMIAAAAAAASAIHQPTPSHTLPTTSTTLPNHHTSNGAFYGSTGGHGSGLELEFGGRRCASHGGGTDGSLSYDSHGLGLRPMGREGSHGQVDGVRYYPEHLRGEHGDGDGDGEDNDGSDVLHGHTRRTTTHGDDAGETFTTFSGQQHTAFYLANRAGMWNNDDPYGCSWRTRDTIYALLSSRCRHIRSCAPTRSLSTSTTSSTSVSTTTANANVSANTLPLHFHTKANQFPIQTSLSVLTTNPTKRRIAQRAMDAAALSVLRAIRNQASSHQRPTHNPTDERYRHDAVLAVARVDKRDRDSEGMTTTTESVLLRWIRSLNNVKDVCFQTAESFLPLSTVSSSSHTMTTGSGAGGDDVPSGKKRSRTNDCGDTPTAVVTTEDGTTHKKRKKGSESSSSSPRCGSNPNDVRDTTTHHPDSSTSNHHDISTPTDSNDNHTVSTTTNTNTPKPKSNTYASAYTTGGGGGGGGIVGGGGGTNIDSRATVSRAILCAAASYTFRNLTPKFDDDGTTGDLHVLDVPQNTHNGDDGGEEGGTGGGGVGGTTTHNSSSSSSTSSSGGGTGHTLPKPKTGTKPIINMGAVMMSAEIFAKRSMEQARGAALRGDKRRRWRMGCARRDVEVWDVEHGTYPIDSVSGSGMGGGESANSVGNDGVGTGTNSTDGDSNREGDVNDNNNIINNENGPPGWVAAVLKNSLRGCTNAFALDKHHTRPGKNRVGTVTESSDEDDVSEDEDEEDDTDDDDEHDENELMRGYYANNGNHGRTCFRPKTCNEEWTRRCMPRLLDIMYAGPGHTMLCDLQWHNRADRVVQLLHQMAKCGGEKNLSHCGTLSTSLATMDDPMSSDGKNVDVGKTETGSPHQKEPNYGPHLIITTAADIQKFTDLFASVDYSYLGTLGYRSSERRCTVVDKDDDDGDDVTSSYPGYKSHLRALQYTGSNARRRHLRTKHFTPISLSGLPDCPFNVIITTYEAFFKDYIHFCQIPFQAVVLDDGMSLLGTAHYDPNGQLGKIFDMGVWSKSDNHAGLAGVGYDNWNFSIDVKRDGSLYDPALRRRNQRMSSTKDVDSVGGAGGGRQHQAKNTTARSSDIKKAGLIGLTARHKIIVASSLHSKYRDAIYPAPVPGLLSFLIPQFADVVREEWDRSRIHTCKESMNHVRKLLCRGICVYTGSDHARDMYSIVMSSMLGTLDLSQFPSSSSNTNNHGSIRIGDSGSNTSDTESDMDDGQTLSAFKKTKGAGGTTYIDDNMAPPVVVPREVPTDEMVSDGKIVQSRRFAASWLRTGSPIRYEIGSASLDYIVNAMKARVASGHVCEEVVAASSITSSGAGGMVTGPAGYRTAVRCGRTFGSEQGLRQHIAALHAPPGTWLCRSCACDCGTSQARTHHERSCGTNAGGTPGGVKENSSGGGIPTVGQGIGSAAAGKQVTGLSQGPEDKDKDGCFRVPGYRGVWVNPMGKHFVKINGVPLTCVKQEEGDGNADKGPGSITLFKDADEAARMHDDAMKKIGQSKSVEMNFKQDGNRIVYEDAAANAAAGRGLEMLGGGASSVVPALSVINIKDLPKGVVPLLRDPKQTSRTGGNSKRYIYAYRGVCRQARKGHDRWQSQISFGGTNHYLGTFDSEWDAAAIYAWAHLILYGEEATKKAQKEGEEAVAAYEQEKKDIAEGKIIAPPPKAPKKKKAASTKGKPAASRAKTDKKEKKSSDRSSGPKNSSQLKEFMKPIVPKMASKGLYNNKLPSEDDKELMFAASERIFAIREKMGNDYKPNFQGIENALCVPVEDSASELPVGCAMLVGLSSNDCGWDMDALVQSTRLYLEEVPESFVQALRSEYDSDGMNFRFRTVMQGTSCLIGKAGKNLEQAATAFGLMGADLGGTIADIDCNIGGIDGSCSEIAACISYSSSTCSFEFAACNEDDIVTLNGVQVKYSMGSFPLESEAICGVGSRVFMFVLPQATP